MHSRVSGLGALLWGFATLYSMGWIEAQPYCLGSGISLTVVRRVAGTCTCMPERKRRYVVCLMAEGAECTMPTTDAQASIQLATVGSHAVCCLSTLSYSSHPKPP